MIYYLGLGSNIEDRKTHLTKALSLLQKKCSVKKTSSIYETPALLIENSPKSWNKPFLNMAVAVECPLPPKKLLGEIKLIEKKLGRKENTPRWSPRVIDIDLLATEDSNSIHSPELTLPHPQIRQRDFVLSPLKEIAPRLKVDQETALSLSRKLKTKSPTWVDIFNLTPDSFSDGGELHPSSENIIENKIQNNQKHFVQWMDVGGFSTRPEAQMISPEEEWHRVEPFFKTLKKIPNHLMKISIDTFRVQTARKALAAGAAIINDVSGLSDPEMMPLLKDFDCDYILMHSLTVPADKNIVLKNKPVAEIKNWLEEKLNLFQKNKIHLNRIIFDPGIGFGKTAEQSLEILQNITEFMNYPVRLMMGHSRKSFMSVFSKQQAQNRTPESIGISMYLAQQGVDLLRVHQADQHARAWLAFRHACQS